MKIDLSSKTAIVTGSTSGIGFAIAQGLYDAGADVVINGRTPDRVSAAVARLTKSGGANLVRGVAADLTTVDGFERFSDEVESADILVNNLGVYRNADGIYEPQSFFDVVDEEWERFFQANVMSAVRMSRRYVPAMVDQDWGRVVFISSESALVIPEKMVHYGASKTMLLGVARGLAENVAGSGVTVNSILPGPTASEGVMRTVNERAEARDISVAQIEEAYFSKTRTASLIKRFQSVEEIASMAVFLSSKQASGITGAALRVEGGVVPSVV